VKPTTNSDTTLRVRSILERSIAAEVSSAWSLWTVQPNHPPEVYGDAGRSDVEILSITGRIEPRTGSDA
jgi:hypothetical protein